jgi:hypothetical protein
MGDLRWFVGALRALVANKEMRLDLFGGCWRMSCKVGDDAVLA